MPCFLADWKSVRKYCTFRFCLLQLICCLSLEKAPLCHSTLSWKQTGTGSSCRLLGEIQTHEDKINKCMYGCFCKAYWNETKYNDPLLAYAAQLHWLPCPDHISVILCDYIVRLEYFFPSTIQHTQKSVTLAFFWKASEVEVLIPPQDLSFSHSLCSTGGTLPLQQVAHRSADTYLTSCLRQSRA